MNRWRLILYSLHQKMLKEYNAMLITLGKYKIGRFKYKPLGRIRAKLLPQVKCPATKRVCTTTVPTSTSTTTSPPSPETANRRHRRLQPQGESPWFTMMSSSVGIIWNISEIVKGYSSTLKSSMFVESSKFCKTARLRPLFIRIDSAAWIFSYYLMPWPGFEPTSESCTSLRDLWKDALLTEQLQPRDGS